MNSFMEGQIRNIVLMTDSFLSACEIAAKKDDGKISRDEEKQLKKIRSAVKKFQDTLNHME